MDVFNPPERQQIIPPPPPPTSTTVTSSTTSSTLNNPSANINSTPATFSSGFINEQNTNIISSSSGATGTGTAGAGNQNNNVTVTIDSKQLQTDLDRRQLELDMKAAELEARERALRQGGEQFRRQHNWPPLPSFCPLKPCFFQDINIDIRPEFQKIVQLGYHLWVFFIFTLMLNLFAAILLVTYGVERAGQNVSFGLMIFIFLVPLTYMSWFRPLYKAFKNDSSFNFMVFFFVFFMQTLIVGLWSLGLPTEGPCGFYVAYNNLGVSVLLTMVLFLVTVGWIAYTAASALYLLKVHSIYKSSGASMAKARNEFAQGIISNQYVQQTVANAARQTVNQTFASATTSTANNQR